MWTRHGKRKLKKIAFFTLLLFVFQTAPPVQLWMPWTAAELYMHIAGKVTDADTGQPIVGLEIIAVKQGVQQPESGTATTTINGDYDICCVPPGTYHVFSNPQSNYVREQSPREITVVRGRNVVNTNLNLKKGSMVIGSVYNADGTTFTSQAVVLAIQKSDTEQDIGYFVTAGDGRYVVRGLKPGQPYHVYAGKAGGQTLIRQEIQAPAAGEALQNFQFTLGNPATKISGTVESNGVKIKNAEVRVFSDKSVGYAKTDEQGQYIILGLIADSFTVVVQAKGFKTYVDPDALVIDSGQEAIKSISIPASNKSGKALPKQSRFINKLATHEKFLFHRVASANAATEAFAQAEEFLLRVPKCQAELIIAALLLVSYVLLSRTTFWEDIGNCHVQEMEEVRMQEPSPNAVFCELVNAPGIPNAIPGVPDVWYCLYQCFDMSGNPVGPLLERYFVGGCPWALGIA